MTTEISKGHYKNMLNKVFTTDSLVDDPTLIFGVLYDLLLVILEIENRFHTDGMTRGVGIALEMVKAED